MAWSKDIGTDVYLFNDLETQNTMKKYILAKDLPDHPAGTELEYDTVFSDCYSTPNPKNTSTLVLRLDELQRAIANDWVKEVEDRVVLMRNITHDYRTVEKSDSERFTQEECKLMEKALNGELVEVDLQKFVRWWFDHPGTNSDMTHAELLEAFNAREK